MKGKIVKGGDRPEDAPRESVAPAPSKKLIKKDVHSAREEGKQILSGAEEQAESIVSDAQAEADAIRAKAKDEGYEAGLGELHALTAEFRAQRKKLLEDSRDDVLKLAVKIAGKILGREVAQSEDALTDIVIRAMRGIGTEKRIEVRVNPDDLKAIRKNRKKLLDEVGPNKEIELREDHTVSPGGCIVESDLGIIDARLETQLRVLERALLNKKG